MALGSPFSLFGTRSAHTLRKQLRESLRATWRTRRRCQTCQKMWENTQKQKLKKSEAVFVLVSFCYFPPVGVGALRNPSYTARQSRGHPAIYKEDFRVDQMVDQKCPFTSNCVLANLLKSLDISYFEMPVMRNQPSPGHHFISRQSLLPLLPPIWRVTFFQKNPQPLVASQVRVSALCYGSSRISSF